MSYSVHPTFNYIEIGIYARNAKHYVYDVTSGSYTTFKIKTGNAENNVSYGFCRHVKLNNIESFHQYMHAILMTACYKNHSVLYWAYIWTLPATTNHSYIYSEVGFLSMMIILRSNS